MATTNDRNSWRQFWRNFPLRTGNRFFDYLLLAIPSTLALKYTGRASPLLVFITAAAAIIPLATILGTATEALSAVTGPRLGGLLNATLGNATELILGFFMLRAGQVEIVKASLSGSIIGNTLLVLGMSTLLSGLRNTAHVKRQTAQSNSSMLFVAVAALVMPAIFSFSLYGALKENGHRVVMLSRWTSVILVLVYALNFTRMLLAPRLPVAEKSGNRPVPSAKASVVALMLATVLLSFVSEILVDQIEAAKQALGISGLFMGVVVIAIIGNVAEHSSALLMARKDRMELAYVITVGSSVQIALLVAPALVLLSWAMQKPMSLLFSPLEIAGICIAVAAVIMLAWKDEPSWLDGVQLLAIYLIFVLAIYFMPAHSIL